MVRLPDIDGMYREMARGLGHRVCCRKCGSTQEIDPAQCLRHGWPKCCGQTMSIDAPATDAEATS